MVCNNEVFVWSENGSEGRIYQVIGLRVIVKSICVFFMWNGPGIDIVTYLFSKWNKNTKKNKQQNK